MAQNHWSLGLCDCCNYRDHKGSCHFFPTFFPQALFGSCCIEGEIQTILSQEKVMCCRMGKSGWCSCLLQLPIGLFGPFGGILLAIICGPKLRNEVVKAYNIKDSGCCLGKLFISLFKFYF